jgi:PQQ-dependent catabolism-associated CXXCW motif protein
MDRRAHVVLSAVFLFSLSTAAPVLAQGFAPLGQAPAAGGPPPLPAPQAAPPFGGPPAGGPPPLPQAPAGGGFDAGAGGAAGGGGGFGFPGFGGGPPQAQTQQPVRQNYADELTDFGVPPQTTLQQNVGSPTPMTIPGGHVITTNEVRQALGSDIVFVDVWDTSAHPTIPGAIPMPGAGNAGSFNDQTEQQLWQALSQVTQRQQQRPIIFFCTGSRCWESYNAALRAINMGFQMVLWYRGGLTAWQAAGLPMTGQQQGQFQQPQQGRIGFQ